MTGHDDDFNRDPPAVGAWLLCVAFVLVVLTALAYGVTR